MPRHPKFSLIFAPATFEHLDDGDLERLLWSRSPRLQALLNQSRRSIRSGRGLSVAAFWKAAKPRRRNSVKPRSA